jgi:hypothetical protein
MSSAEHAAPPDGRGSDEARQAQAGSRYADAMPVSETPRTATTHLEAEVRVIVRVLRSYGPLPKSTLEHLIGAEHWRHVYASDAIRAAVAQGRVRALGAGFYEAA